ncbi:MAG: hypothetical protein K8S25_11915 [Alphaproteobacteria bacterium]|nr:hypothetical protein [Alphaproteobacteria bacterium]
MGPDDSADKNVRVADPDAPGQTKIILRSALGVQAEKNRQANSARAGSAFERLAKIALASPEDAGVVAEDAKGIWDGVSTVEQNSLKERYNQIAENSMRARIAQNPQEALQTLRSREGYAEEDLGISEDTRSALELEAQFAADEEKQASDRAREESEIAWIAETHEGAKSVIAGTQAPGFAYEPVLASVVADSKLYRKLEETADQAVAHAATRSHAKIDVGTSLNARKKSTWNDKSIQALDDHYLEIASLYKGAWPEWKVEYARLAGRLPRAMRAELTGDILQTRDAKRREQALQTLLAFSDAKGAGGDLSGQFSGAVRKIGMQAQALMRAGYSIAGALKRIDGANTIKPELREAREAYYDRHGHAHALLPVLSEVFDGADVRVGAADETIGGQKLDDLVYRPSEGFRLTDGVYREDGSLKTVELGYADGYGGSDGGTIYGGHTPPGGRRGYDVEDLDYAKEDLAKLGEYREKILSAARTLGVSEGAIAGAIAEEIDDTRARGRLEYVQWAAKWARLAPMSHEDINADYEQWEQVLKKDPSSGEELPPWYEGGIIWQKTRHPVLIDIGWGKIRLHTAIRMLREYNVRYPENDPLGIKRYNSAYDALARDLESAKESTTAAFAGLMVAEATNWFDGKAPDLWKSLTPDEQDALIVDYYNLGREKIAKRYREDMDRDGNYTPENGDSGKRHRANAGKIRQALYLF